MWESPPSDTTGDTREFRRDLDLVVCGVVTQCQAELGVQGGTVLRIRLLEYLNRSSEPLPLIGEVSFTVVSRYLFGPRQSIVGGPLWDAGQRA